MPLPFLKYHGLGNDFVLLEAPLPFPLSTKTVIADNTWYHLAFVFDGKATGTGKLKLYVNGVLESSTTHPATAVDKSTAPLWVGELDAARGFAWDGVIDEVGVWNIALTAAEVTQVMNEGKAKLFNRGLATNPAPGLGAIVEEPPVGRSNPLT